jgi:hypothetical protein
MEEQVKMKNLDSQDGWLKFWDEIVISGGGCDTPTQSHRVSGGIFVILRKYIILLEFSMRINFFLWNKYI